jgi:hypothetical protein
LLGEHSEIPRVLIRDHCRRIPPTIEPDPAAARRQTERSPPRTLSADALYRTNIVGNQNTVWSVAHRTNLASNALSSPGIWNASEKTGNFRATDRPGRLPAPAGHPQLHVSFMKLRRGFSIQ